MCKCTPSKRTPFCGAPGCEDPRMQHASVSTLDRLGKILAMEAMPEPTDEDRWNAGLSDIKAIPELNERLGKILTDKPTDQEILDLDLDTGSARFDDFVAEMTALISRHCLVRPTVQGGYVAVPVLSGSRQALVDIAFERKRQITDEGYTPAKDDERYFDPGQLSMAAACYAAGVPIFLQVAKRGRDNEERYLTYQDAWPWGASHWKPKGRRRDLVRAAALIVAEIEWLDRRINSEPPRNAS